MEILDVVDELGVPTGERVERDMAHEKGIRHRTSHVWIVRYKEKRLQVLLQKRSAEKDSYPGCFDISSAGHIPAGVDFVSSALRELEEELGVKVGVQQLICCGQRKFTFEKEFHGKHFHDNQVSNVYILWLDREERDFCLQKEEISDVRWFDFEECEQNVRENRIPHCIYMEELLMVKETALENGAS
ncbi:MAG: NUDIX domain-containing protein [Eubacteriales bacterium]|nr:NUDIX domain-containing protein [Eubacteriales bacterium]